jgi:hypothetical protein
MQTVKPDHGLHSRVAHILSRDAPGATYIDPLMNRLFHKEETQEQAILNKAIHGHVYTLPPTQDVHECGTQHEDDPDAKPING